MKTLLLILSLIATTLNARVEKDLYLSHWKLVMDGSKGGNSIRSVERKITTPYSRYIVAQVTMVEFNFKGEKSLESTRSFLQKEFRLNGLQEKKIGDAYRFEGYREDIRRQVVVFVSFIEGKIKVSSGFYRPTYGKTIALEVELFHRNYHQVDRKVTFLKNLNFTLPFISNAYAQQDCTKCAGNPMCLMLCRSANGGGSIGSVGGSLPGTDAGGSSSGGLLGGMGGLNLDQIQSQLSATNTQLNALNENMGVMNQNWGATNTQIEASNANWAETNVQLSNANSNWEQTNQKLDETNNQLADANKNLENLTNVVDQNAKAALEESQAWRAMTEKESAEWRALVKEQGDRGLAVAEKMSDPNHLFKIATFSAAGAVLGATAANLAISGVQQSISFLFKWATGELKEMKQEELLREFNQAMKVYSESSNIAKGLEQSIDAVLSNIALHKKFELENSELLANIQKYIITTQFEIEDATRDRCVDKLVGLNQKMVEFQSIAKILDMPDPQRQMCLDLKEMFRKLAEIEGVLQNARPNLLVAEDALNWQKARSQNESAENLEQIRKGDVADDVKKTQERQRRELYERNVEDTEKLSKDVERDCRDSFEGIRLQRNAVKNYCKTLTQNKANATPQGLAFALPALTESQRATVVNNFQEKYIPLGLDQIETYQKQRTELFAEFDAEVNRHHQESQNLGDRLQLDPRVALEEMRAINEFTEKLMREQAYLYSNGIKVKKTQFEEACQSIN